MKNRQNVLPQEVAVVVDRVLQAPSNNPNIISGKIGVLREIGVQSLNAAEDYVSEYFPGQFVELHPLQNGNEIGFTIYPKSPSAK